MKINPIDNLDFVVSVDKVKMVKKAQQDENGDRLEISKQAKKMAESDGEISPERLKLIRDRIESGYYNQDEVLKEVASRIMKSPRINQFLGSGDTDPKA